jgi:hypothetical protein
MGISLAEATGLLLLGKKVTWNKFKNHRAGSIVLDKPEQRRLLEFLLGADSNHVASGDESLRLVVGIDEEGTRYFKRLRCHQKIVVLESLNPDGLTASEVLSLDGSHSLPRITEALEVVGVLFELPDVKL